MKRKRNRTTCSSALNSSYSQQTVTSYYLPDECWNIIINDNDEDCNKNNHYLSTLSLVSKQFLSITNRIKFSLTVSNESTCCRLFKRFTNLNSLNLTSNYIDLDNLLIEISRFPLKQLTSLNLSYQDTIPAIGLRVFSQRLQL
ncbi:F-box/LRR-repeat protein [Trifolium repens]|nr:F-box/LRR-repeat protein [Trifolium repens]